MDKDALIVRLKEIVEPYTQNQQELEHISEATDFINDLKINSANLVDVILDVEEAFDIEIDNASMERMINVKLAIEIIEAKLSGNARE